MCLAGLFFFAFPSLPFLWLVCPAPRTPAGQSQEIQIGCLCLTAGKTPAIPSSPLPDHAMPSSTLGHPSGPSCWEAAATPTKVGEKEANSNIYLKPGKTNAKVPIKKRCTRFERCDAMLIRETPYKCALLVPVRAGLWRCITQTQ